MKSKTSHLLRPTSYSLPISLLRTRELIMREIRPILHQHGVTEQQWRVLRVVCESDGASDVSSIARRTCILAPSLTRIIRTLSTRNLIQVHRNPNDRRKVMVQSTDDGYLFIEKVAPHSTQVFTKLRTIVGEERWENILQILIAFRDDINHYQDTEHSVNTAKSRSNC